MQLVVVGLGNPGSRYQSTRHNVGFRVLDVLATRLRLSYKKPFLRPYVMARGEVHGSGLVLVKPLTFMNRSGEIFPQILGKVGVGLERLLVVCDSLDLPTGQCRLRRRGSSGGHNGLGSIIRRLGREDFMRLHIGIGHPGSTRDVVGYVLGPPEGAETAEMEQAARRAADAILELLEETPETVMNALNQKH